ncbi:MAG: DUF192 domain-containing protein [Nanoarchaeota archaeon]
MIRNESKGVVLAERHRVCASVWSKSKGLMWSRRDADLGLVFLFRRPRRIGIHMWFVFYAIDVAFLDAQGVVIEVCEDFRPFAAYTSRKEASAFIELVAGTLRRTATAVGDRIVWS